VAAVCGGSARSLFKLSNAIPKSKIPLRASKTPYNPFYTLGRVEIPPKVLKFLKTPLNALCGVLRF